MNVFTVTGNLGQDAEVKQVNTTTVCNFSVAAKAGFGDKAQTIWLDCALWGKQAESALPGYLVKGQQVAVSGELSTFEATSGKTYLKLRCNSVDLIGKKDDSAKAAPTQTATAQAPVQAQASGAEPIDDFEDDIPFS
jgi:single-strand DNA-binding protein